MSSTVVVHGVPESIESAKDEDAGVHVDGAHVAISEMLAALLEHGSADRYYFICGSARELGRARRTLASYPGAGRGEVLTTGMLASLADRERVVLQLPNVQLYALDEIRRSVGRPEWPVFGTTMLLSYQAYPGFPLMALAMMFGKLRPYDCLVCTSRASQNAFERLTEAVRDALSARFGLTLPHTHRYAVIPLGVDTASFEPRDRALARRVTSLPEDEVILLYFGRFAFDSKMDLFPIILVFAQLLADRRSRQAALPWLLLAGDDCERQVAPQLASFAAELGVADRVIIRTDVDRSTKRLYYSAADVFVSPSDNPQETFGITVIEAMASGLPVIVSDWNGYRDHIEDGVEGFLVPTYWNTGVDYISRLASVRGDRPTHWLLAQSIAVDPAGLRARMDALVDAPDRRAAMGERAKRRAETTYDWSVVIHQYEALWEESLDIAAQSANEAEDSSDGVSIDMFEIFGHYTTQQVTRDARIRLTALGRQLTANQLPLRLLTADGGPFASREARRIAHLAEDDDHWMCHTLADRAASELRTSPELTLHHIAGLLKFGLMELV